MPIIQLDEVDKESFANGATYQTVVGDADGSTPVRIGIQVSPPGYSTGTHAHPYFEAVTVLEGHGEAWMEGREGTVPIGPGTTLAMPPGTRHGFRVTGDRPMTTYGVHASPTRVVERFEGEP